MKKNIISLFYLITISVNCSSQKSVDSIQNELTGKWFSNDSLVRIEFSSDKIYTFFKKGEKLFINPYQIKIIEDSIFMYHIDGQDTLKYLLYLDGNELLQINYKYGKGINDHIDEIGFFYKKIVVDTLVNRAKMQFNKGYCVPINFKGEIRIAYNSLKKISSADSYTKTKLVDIPNSGLIELYGKEDIQAYARQYFRFFYKSASNNENVEIPKFDIYREYSEQELKKYKDDDIYVVYLGYNQLNRQDINISFGKNIVGNVEFYKIDTFKKLRAYLQN